MILDDLRHEAVHRSTRSDDQMKNVGAAFFFFERALDCLDLTADSSYPVQEFRFLLNGVRHRKYFPLFI